MKFIGIIPARYASTRFPGKPLVEIGGRTMIRRVYDQAKQVLDTVVVATDDERIYDHVESFGGNVVMTRADHACGTDRCLEAYNAITTPQWRVQNDEQTIIINIQGDEPFIQPEQIHALQSCFEDIDGCIETEIATLVKPFTEEDTLEDLENPNSPKVVFNETSHYAMLFSRSVIPYLRNVEKSQWLKAGKHYRHIGMYAYRADVLAKITTLKQSNIELCESLEQMRWLENGYKIKVATCNITSIGIDTPEDLENAKKLINLI
jgi:3-deoxy-manno-octulosonate cytidylyltransferase (CMP-KDO synthetase)